MLHVAENDDVVHSLARQHMDTNGYKETEYHKNLVIESLDEPNPEPQSYGSDVIVIPDGNPNIYKEVIEEPMVEGEPEPESNMHIIYNIVDEDKGYSNRQVGVPGLSVTGEYLFNEG